jgi:hypothetical protein
LYPVKCMVAFLSDIDKRPVGVGELMLSVAARSDQREAALGLVRMCKRILSVRNLFKVRATTLPNFPLVRDLLHGAYPHA